MRDIIALDIETRRHDERYHRNLKPYKGARPRLLEFDPENREHNKLGNIKDEEKRAIKTEENRGRWNAAQYQKLVDWEEKKDAYFEKTAEKAALYPGMSEICAIGWQIPGEYPVTLLMGDEGVSCESELLRAFLTLFRQVTESPVASGGNYKFGFWSGNSSRDSYFDYNHLREAVRRQKTAVNMAYLVGPGQRHSPWVDLSGEFFGSGAILPQCDGYPAFLSLNDAAEYVGWPHEGEVEEFPIQAVGKEECLVTGAEFGEALRDPSMRETCRDYLINDLALTRHIANNSLVNLV